MDERIQATTSPFFTLDAFDGDLAIMVMEAIEKASSGEEKAWTELVEGNADLRERLTSQGIAKPESFTAIRWDAANLLFTCCVQLDRDGRPYTVGDRLTRERFGRFPYGDGSALGYLLEFMRPNRSITDHDGQSIYDQILEELNNLAVRCTEERRGHTNFERGFGGMSLLGFITAEGIQLLRKNLSSRAWTASYEEPLDGGVADVAKHLLTLLKGAERRGVGIALRIHR
jgi:hypothetical protein